MADSKAPKPAERGDDEVLEEIRERYEYGLNEWREIREQGAIDMRFVAGEHWDPKDKKDREENGRPALSLDELGQYINQTINDIRQNKRAIKLTPVGEGANDQSADLRENIIRQIEYRSNAQQAYTVMFENAVQRGYGYLRIKPRYVSPSGFDQELLIEPIPNPDLVTPDPDGIKSDLSDIGWAFVGETYTAKQFKREWPDAEIQDFGADEIETAPQWIKGDGHKVLVAEYWTIDHVRRHLLALKPGKPQIGPDGQIDPASLQPRLVYADELPKGKMPPSDQILRDRWVDAPYVCQYLTNGVELLAKKGQPKKTEWPGKSIPIVGCFGKVLYVNEGDGIKRRLLSMIRLARDPQLLYSYYRTNEQELVGMTPKTPYVGYVGQFRTRADEWQAANHKPQAYLEADPVIEAAGPQLLPLPQRQSYDPPIQALEVGAESARRAIQAAMGISPLPTSAQRRNEKSGVALKQIEDSGQKGSFHFVDHFNDAIQRTGAIVDELLPSYYDAARQVTLRKPDESTEQVTINDPSKPTKDGTVPKVGEELHDVTISVGPAYESEREAASEFADSIIANPIIPQIAGPQKMAKMIAQAIKLKAVGPIGDQMAELIDPGEPGEPPDPVQLQAQLQQMQQQLQEAQKAIETEQAKQQAMIETERIAAQKDIEIAKIRADVELQKARMALTGKEDEAASKVIVKGNELQHESIENALDREHEQRQAAAGHFRALEQGEQSAFHAQRQAETAAQQKASEQ